MSKASSYVRACYRGNTRRVELLWQVLDSAHVSCLVPAKPAVIEVGKMGERSAQDSSHQVAATKV